MKILKNRKTAIFIAVIVMILAAVLGVRKSLDTLARNVEKLFYSEGYGQTNIDAQLRKRIDAAMGIITITSNYPELEAQTQELRQARLALIEAENISEKGYADLRVSFAIDAMFTLGTENNGGYNRAGIKYSQRDETALLEYLETILGASGVISRGAKIYNAEVEKFISGQMYSPLAGLIKPFVFVKEPQKFINSQT